MAPLLDPAKWRRIRGILDELIAAAPAERDGLLAERCAGDPDLMDEIRSFLRAHEEAGSFIERPPTLSASLPMPPPELDRYRIVGELDRGGMAVVYTGVRDDEAYRQTVAIKVMRHGFGNSETVARFRAERQILAQLEHPNIARLLDGGTTADGRPYLVMEHVLGVPIDTFCDEHRFGTEARIRLFGKVCRAVQFAHRNLIVHRDLKPGNILVTPDGEPKLLDFGIAKLLDPRVVHHTVAHTRTDALGPMTPAYASPEQARGEPITTSSDVYSLGVVLYELLTGHRPYRADSDNPLLTLERIAEAEPERPSRVVSQPATRRSPSGDAVEVPATEIGARRGTDPGALRRRLRGDLDMVLLEALRKEPERRYSSADALADDLDRHLRGLPVEARPDTFRYRAAKFARRHAIAVSASAALLAVLVTALLVLLLQRQTILAERDEAQRVSAFLTELFAIPDPTRSRGEAITARELLDRGARSIGDELASSPATQGALMLTMGRSYKNLGLLTEADALLATAEQRLEAAYGRRHPEVASALHERADVALEAGRYADAVALFEEALTVRLATLGERHRTVAETRLRLGRALTSVGHWDRAETELGSAFEIAQAAGETALAAEILEPWASLAAERGLFDLAEQRYRRALATLRQIHGSRHPAIVVALNDLATLERRRERWAAAEARLEEARALAVELFDGDHHHLANIVGNLALVRLQAGDLTGAAETFDEALRLHRAVFAPDHPKLAVVLANLARLHRARGDLDEAVELLRESLGVLEAGLGPDHPETANAANNLAELYLGMGRLDAAAPLVIRAVEALEAAHPRGHPRLAIALANRGDLLQQRGRLEDASAVYARAIEMTRSGPDPESSRLAHLLSNSGTVLQELGEVDAALERYEESLSLLSDDGPHLLTAATATRLAHLELKREHWSRTVELATLALARFPDEMPWRLQWLGSAVDALARARLELGQPDAAASALEPVLAEAREQLGEDDATTRALAKTLEEARRLASPP